MCLESIYTNLSKYIVLTILTRNICRVVFNFLDLVEGHVKAKFIVRDDVCWCII